MKENKKDDNRKVRPGPEPGTFICDGVLFKSFHEFAEYNAHCVVQGMRDRAPQMEEENRKRFAELRQDRIEEDAKRERGED